MLGAKDIAVNLRRCDFKRRYNKVHEALNLFLARSRTGELNASATAQGQRANAQRRAAAPKGMSGRAHVNDKALK